MFAHAMWYDHECRRRRISPGYLDRGSNNVLEHSISRCQATFLPWALVFLAHSSSEYQDEASPKDVYLFGIVFQANSRMRGAFTSIGLFRTFYQGVAEFCSARKAAACMATHGFGEPTGILDEDVNEQYVITGDCDKKGVHIGAAMRSITLASTTRQSIPRARICNNHGTAFIATGASVPTQKIVVGVSS